MFEIDGVRLRDVSPFGLVFGGGVAGLGLYIGIGTLAGANEIDLVAGLGLGVFLLAGGAFLAYQDARPEFDGACEHCGERIVANTGAEGVDEFVCVERVGEPKRLTVGGYSIILSRQQRHYDYCSPACADAHVRHVPPAGVDVTDASDSAAYEVVD